MSNKVYKNQLKKIETKLDNKYPKTQNMFSITTDINGKITITDFNNNEYFNQDKEYKSVEEAKQDIENYAKKNSIEPFILNLEIVGNSDEAIELLQ